MSRITSNFYFILAPFFYLVVLTGCGGGDSANTVDNPDQQPTEQTTTPLQAEQRQGGFQSISQPTFTGKTAIQPRIDEIAQAAGVSIDAAYDVDSYKLEYWTLDTADTLVKVSGMLAIPRGSGPAPILSFQHGTLYQNSEAPSNRQRIDGDYPEIILASLGYIVFAPDYIGYGSSHGLPHPYLQRIPSADTVVDMLHAGQSWLEAAGIAWNGQLFLSGYSQGGYVSMAAHEKLQDELGEPVTAVVMGAGPYDLFEALDELFYDIRLGGELVDYYVNLIADRLIPDNSDIIFDTTFLRRHMNDDRRDDVHQWKPLIPMKLFHGQQDETVPIESAQSAYNVMTSLGADVELVLCDASPSTHENCIYPYVTYMLEYFESYR